MTPDANGWLPMEVAPKNVPILAWCDHEADPYVEDKRTGRLTLYGAHSEGMGHADTGYHIIEWGGAFDDSTHEFPDQASLPDWWFVCGSEFECAANPVKWQHLPPVKP